MAKWFRITWEKYGYDGAVASLQPITGPEEIRAFDLVEVEPESVLTTRPPCRVPLNADGMSRRAYVISLAEFRAEQRIRAYLRENASHLFQAKTFGSYWENGREYGISRSIYLVRVGE